MKKAIGIILSLIFTLTLCTSLAACTTQNEKSYYYVKYYVNGTQYGTTQSVEQGKSAALYAFPDTEPDEGYHYLWQAEGGQYYVSTVFTPEENINIYLVQVKNPPEAITHYAITYLVDGAQYGAIQSIVVGHGALVYNYPNTTPSKGYHYVWSSNGVQYEAGTTFTPTKDIALELIEVPDPPVYSITYKVNGQVFGQPQQVASGSSAVIFDIPATYAREGYSYYWKVDGGERVTSKKYTPAGDVVMNLEEVANVGTVKFAICDASNMLPYITGTMQSVNLKTGDSIPTPTFNCSGVYEFKGWSLVNSYGSVFSPTPLIDEIVIPTDGGMVTVYAQYTKSVI